jgi:hypothetical protein
MDSAVVNHAALRLLAFGYWGIPPTNQVGKSSWQIKLANQVGKSCWQIMLAIRADNSHR